MTAVCILFVLLAAMALTRLGAQPLRLDEARTALLADTILASGLPRVEGPGPPMFGASEVGRGGLCVLHTPVQYYWAALGRLVSPSPYMTRLPFSLAGVAAVGLLAWTAERTVPGGAAFCVATTTQVSILLLLRQARHYSLTLLASSLAILAISVDSVPLAILAGILLAASEWTAYLATWAGALVAAVVGSWALPAALGLSSGLFVVALWMWARRGAAPPVPRHRGTFVDGFLESFWTYVWKMNILYVPILLFASVAIAVGVYRPAEMLTGLAWIVFANIAMRAVTPAVFARYLCGALAPAILFTAILLAEIFARLPALAVILAVTQSLTDILHRLHLLLPPAFMRQLAFVRAPGGAHLAREAPEDARRRPLPLLAMYICELIHPPRLRVDGLAEALPFRSRVVIGQSEAPALQVAAPHLEVIPWGDRPSLELAWLAEHPPDVIVLGDLDRTERLESHLSGRYRRRILPVVDVLMANGESLERHMFRTPSGLTGVEVLERCDLILASC